MKRKGFSLVEILVVLGIIAVLAAILFPVTVGAMSKGRDTVCSNQLKQIALAINVYMNDNDDFPPFSLNALPESLVKTCPRDEMAYRYNAQFMVVSKTTGKPEYASGFDPAINAVVKCQSHFYWDGKVSQVETNRGGKVLRYSVPVDAGNYEMMAAFMDGHIGRAPLLDDWQIAAQSSQ